MQILQLSSIQGEQKADTQIIKEYLTLSELQPGNLDIDGIKKFIEERVKNRTQFYRKIENQMLNQLPPEAEIAYSPMAITSPTQKSAIVTIVLLIIFQQFKKHSKRNSLERKNSFRNIGKNKKPNENLPEIQVPNKWIKVHSTSDDNKILFDPKNQNAKEAFNAYYSIAKTIIPSRMSMKKNNSEDFNSSPEKSKMQYSDFCNQIQANLSMEGFSSSTLNMLYPSFKTIICSSELESKSFLFSDKKIMDQEFQSYACSHFIYIILRSYQTYEQNFDQFMIFKAENLGEDIFSAILDSKSINFERLTQNYLIKLYTLEKQKVETHSALECGKIVNLVLENVQLYFI